MKKNQIDFIIINLYASNQSLSTISEFTDTNYIYCDRTQLFLPENAQEWICDFSYKDEVAKNGKCYLECKKFFRPIYSK